MIANWFRVECNLCGQQFDVDKDWGIRSWKHKETHIPNKNAKSQNRIHGKVEWLII